MIPNFLFRKLPMLTLCILMLAHTLAAACSWKLSHLRINAQLNRIRLRFERCDLCKG